MAYLNLSSNKQVELLLYYEDQGAGQPVVLIHGWPLCGRAWEKQVPVLVDAGYRVITYDRRGFGQSSKPWQGYDYDTFADDLQALLTHLDLRDVTLVGFSMGGGEVARYIGRYGSGRLAKAVLAAAVTPYLYKAGDNPEGGLDDASIEQFEQGVRTDRLAFLDDFSKNFFAANDKTDLISEPARQYHCQIAAFASPKATLDCIRAFAGTDFRADLAKFNLPTLILHGDSDGIVPFAVSGKRAHDMITGSQLALVKGAPHGFNATHAVEFNQALLDFLKR